MATLTSKLSKDWHHSFYFLKSIPFIRLVLFATIFSITKQYDGMLLNEGICLAIANLRYAVKRIFFTLIFRISRVTVRWKKTGSKNIWQSFHFLENQRKIFSISGLLKFQTGWSTFQMSWQRFSIKWPNYLFSRDFICFLPFAVPKIAQKLAPCSHKLSEWGF